MSAFPSPRGGLFLLLFSLGLGLASLARAGSAAKPDAVVATDGSGQYTTVQEAINAVPQTTSAQAPWFILVKPGTYSEVVYIQREKHHVHLIGEDATKTVITAGLYAGVIGPDKKPIGTFRTPTVQIDADDFTVENLTLKNSAGDVGQALAVRVDGDRIVFRHCRFLGWQDTILANRGRHYFADCYITGAIDFIFGGATAYFENCDLEIAGTGYITAASTPRTHPYGFVFKNCRISGQKPEIRTYLGRPWRDFASVTFLNTDMTDVVRPEGWHNWDKPDREKTSRYFEYGSTGTGAQPDKRVRWAHTLTTEEAAALTPAKVLRGNDGWDPVAQP